MFVEKNNEMEIQGSSRDTREMSETVSNFLDTYHQKENSKYPCICGARIRTSGNFAVYSYVEEECVKVFICGQSCARHFDSGEFRDKLPAREKKSEEEKKNNKERKKIEKELGIGDKEKLTECGCRND